MKVAGVGFPEAHLNAAAMAELAAAGHEVLGYDTVMPVFSVTQEAAALGCEVDWGYPEMMPGARTQPFTKAGELLLPDGWIEAPSIQVVLEALALLRRALGDHVVIVGKVMGPWSLSYLMMGIEEFLVSTLRAPGRARQSLEVLKAVPIAFARAQVQAGVDIICLADHATGSMISPVMYRDLLLPIHQEIVAAIGCPTVLHCCGKTTDRLGYFADTGIDCYHFESQVRVEDAVSAAKGKMTLMGNVNNPDLLLQGTPEEVGEACRRIRDGGVQILAPECAVPLTTPTRNLQVLVSVATEARGKRGEGTGPIRKTEEGKHASEERPPD
jgi:[methyl-Co(III) methanol-specific corrinoid protein]:coenzyme M methyltransferase